MRKKLSLFVLSLLLGVSSVSAHSKAIKPDFVDSVLVPYFELQGSLAGDDLVGAKKNAATLQAIVLMGPSFEEAASLEGLSDEARAIIDAADIKVARTAFHAVSKNMVKMVEHVGTTGESDVLQMRCPMAFKGKGGVWLQASDDLRNPYYGAMMLTCGSVQKQLAKGLEKEADNMGKKEHDHSGHDHSGHSY